MIDFYLSEAGNNLYDIIENWIKENPKHNLKIDISQSCGFHGEVIRLKITNKKTNYARLHIFSLEELIYLEKSVLQMEIYKIFNIMNEVT